MLFQHPPVNTARDDTGNDAGNQTGHRSHTVNIDQKTVQPRNHAGGDANPGTKQNAARHNSDDTHIQQRTVDINARPGTEQRKQGKDGRYRHFLRAGVFIFLQQLTKRAGARQEEQADQHQGGAVKYCQ